MDDTKIKMPVEIEQYERKIYDLKQLIEISKGLNSTLEYNTLIDSILLTCMGQMQLLKAGIFLPKSIGFDNFALHRNYKGFEIDHSIEYEISADSKLISFLENDLSCFTLEQLKKHLKRDKSLNIFRKLKPSLIVPLFSRRELNGIIILAERINEEFFNESEKEYLLTIASLAGVAINNARLYEMATTDMMTKLKIHHYFQTALIEEVDRAFKYNRHLSLIMADIDHFKDFNDTYGHLAGDVVLKNVARIVKESVRPTDIASRYGGEEFAIILPKTDIHEALIVAERVRTSVEKEKVKFESKELQVTVSVGLTQYDSTMDKTKKDLIERADKALFASKRGGRNMVSIL